MASIGTLTPNPWVRVLDALEKKVNRSSYETWLKPTRFSHANGNVLFVRVPTPEFRLIGDKFGDLIQEAMDTTAPEYQDVKFVTAEEDPSAPPVRPAGQSPGTGCCSCEECQARGGCTASAASSAC